MYMLVCFFFGCTRLKIKAHFFPLLLLFFHFSFSIKFFHLNWTSIIYTELKPLAYFFVCMFSFGSDICIKIDEFRRIHVNEIAFKNMYVNFFEKNIFFLVSFLYGHCVSYKHIDSKWLQLKLMNVSFFLLCFNFFLSPKYLLLP